MNIEVLTSQLITVENSAYCSMECPFMRMIQDEHTLEFWKVCTLGSPIIPLKHVDKHLYERTDACKEAEINRRTVDSFNDVAEMAWKNGDSFK